MNINEGPRNPHLKISHIREGNPEQKAKSEDGSGFLALEDLISGRLTVTPENRNFVIAELKRQLEQTTDQDTKERVLFAINEALQV